MNAYCTLFDRNYALPGIALWRSLRDHDPAAVLWVLCLDEPAVALVRALGEPDLRAVPLAELEAADPELAAARADRTRVEYLFTLSPCWPRFLLAREPGLTVLAMLDADTAFFSSPAALFAELGDGHVLVTGHRYPAFLRALEERGRFNVGVLCFRNSEVGRACLDDWRRRCLAWCHDLVEAGRYADQKYLNAWPEAFPGVVISRNPGINLAPWNWMNHRLTIVGGRLLVDGVPLALFHFARFQLRRDGRADSGQLEYGVMPLRLRSWLYGRYVALLEQARALIVPRAPDLAWPESVVREHRAAWKTRVLEMLFGSVWWRVGRWWVAGRCGLGRYSGRTVWWVRRHLTRRAEGRR